MFVLNHSCCGWSSKGTKTTVEDCLQIPSLSKTKGTLITSQICGDGGLLTAEGSVKATTANTKLASLCSKCPRSIRSLACSLGQFNEKFHFRQKGSVPSAIPVRRLGGRERRQENQLRIQTDLYSIKQQLLMKLLLFLNKPRMITILISTSVTSQCNLGFVL